MEFALQRPEPGKWAAAVFSLLMHSFLVALLYYGVQWQRRAPEPVSVELVRSLPPIAEPEPVQEVVPQILPPEPVPVEVKPEPVPLKPDIALKEPEKKKPVKKELPKPEPAQSKPVAKPEKKPEAPRVPDWQAKLEGEAKKVSGITTTQRLDKEAADLRAKLDAASQAASLGRATGEWIGQITQKVKSNLVRPQGVQGDLVVEFRIEILPTGEVLGEPKLLKSSGNSSLDEAARRAILKSSPLPKPGKAEIAQREINLKFHPMVDVE